MNNLIKKVILCLEWIAEKNYKVCSPLGFYKPKKQRGSK